MKLVIYTCLSLTLIMFGCKQSNEVKNLNAHEFYIDNELGSDLNSGHSPEKAWKTLKAVNSKTFLPGDKILFKSNQIWNGTLFLKGSGEKNNPIRIDKYGDGENPVINGNGMVNCSNQEDNEHYCTVFLYNQEYWEIANLEITNYNEGEEGSLSLKEWEESNKKNYANKFHPEKFDESRIIKSGILVYARNYGAINHLKFQGLHIHGINGSIETKNNGGIFLQIFGSDKEKPTYFDGLLFEDCNIHDVDRSGISNVSFYDKRTIDTSYNWTPSLNYVVKNNTFSRTGANALILRVAENPLIEYNLFDHCAIKESGNAFFNFNTDGAVLQYNEARFTKYNIDDHDAGGIDSDFKTKNTVLQYNYIHDNDFGPLITGGEQKFNGFNDSTIVRYNRFENDGILREESDGKLNWVFKLSGKTTNTFIHNNLFIIGEKQINRAIIYHKNWGGYPDKTTYFNNIIINKGENNYFELTKSTNNFFTNNALESNPVKSIPPQNNLIKGNLQEQFKSTSYRLKPNSTLSNSGIKLLEMPLKDYYGNLITEPVSIGISNGKDK